MRADYKGKYTHMRRNNPRAIGLCDYSGFTVAQRMLRPQFEYAGRGLVNTGFLVYQRFLDIPNPQNLIPLLKMDPPPLNNTRPDNQVVNPVIPTLTVNLTGLHQLVLTDADVLNVQFNFTGTVAGAVVVVVPGRFQEAYMNNQTIGAGALYVQLFNNSPSLLALPLGQNPIVQRVDSLLTIVHSA